MSAIKDFAISLEESYHNAVDNGVMREHILDVMVREVAQQYWSVPVEDIRRHAEFMYEKLSGSAPPQLLTES